MKRLLPLAAFLLSSAHATTGTGEYFYGPDTSENIACQIAEDFARTDAIRNFLGETFESSTSEQCFNTECFLSQDTSSSIIGSIKKVNKKEVTKSTADGKMICTVTLDADVEKIENDIYFNVWTEQPTFRHGDEVNFYAMTNRAGMITVFNHYDKKFNKILTKKVTDFKDEFPILGKNQVMVAQVPKDKKVSNERLVFIFTELDTETKSVYTDYEMQKFLKTLPITKRRVVYKVAQIVR
jgi:hypothetical protein